MLLEIRDQEIPHTYRTEIPNIIDEMDLSVYAYRLYGHLKKVAGDSGSCWQSVTTLAEACHMSRGMVVNARKELEEKHLIFNDRQKNDKGGQDFCIITIRDIWLENFKKYAASSPTEQPSSPHEHASSYSELTSSPHELKKNPIKKNTIKNLKDSAEKKPPRPRDPRIDHPAIIAFKSTTNRYPIKPSFDTVINILGDSPNLEKLQNCFTQWCNAGFRPVNIAWLTDWYVNGIPTRSNGNGHKPSKPLVKRLEYGVDPASQGIPEAWR